MASEVIQEDIEAEEVEEDQYLVFSVKSQEFGLQAMRVQEISRVLATTEVPNAPPYIEGIVNLRGRLASVINFRRKLGFEPRGHDEDTRIIIVEQAAFPIGVIVDSVEEVLRVPQEKVQLLPEASRTSTVEQYISGVGMLDKRLVLLLDMDRILTTAEVIEMGAMSQMMDKAGKMPQQAESESNESAASAPAAARKRQARRRAK